MKKICIFLSLFFLIFYNQLPIKKTEAKAELSTYAKALSNCVLYKTSSLNNEIDNIYFIVPETYFVIIIEDSVSENCMKVQYGNFIGFIESSKVIISTFIPIVKTLENITCDIKDTSGTQIWSKPSALSKYYTTIPAGTKNINYIATVFGEIPSGGESNIWYYVTYIPANNSTNVYEGYIYSENTSNLTEIVANTETNPEVINTQNNGDYTIYISSPIKVLIISVVAIPIIILFLILISRITKIVRDKNINLKHENLRNINQEKQIQNYNENLENQNYNQNYNQDNLRQEIQNMNGKRFTRKVNSYRRYYTEDYPAFPSYDSDDDLL